MPASYGILVRPKPHPTLLRAFIFSHGRFVFSMIFHRIPRVQGRAGTALVRLRSTVQLDDEDSIPLVTTKLSDSGRATDLTLDVNANGTMNTIAAVLPSANWRRCIRLRRAPRSLSLIH